MIIITGVVKLGITHVVPVDLRQYFLLGAGFGDHVEDSLPSVLRTIQAIFVMVSIFFLVMAAFASLTSKIGELLNRERPLSGYSVNVAGSLLGILAFSWVSYLQWPPVLWLGCASAAIVFLSQLVEASTGLLWFGLGVCDFHELYDSSHLVALLSYCGRHQIGSRVRSAD